MSHGLPRTSLVASDWAAALALIVVGAVLYVTSLSGPFIYDDVAGIVENPNLRHLWPPSISLTAPPDMPPAGRPVVCLSLAVNHALTGLEPAGFRAFNLAVHVLCAIVLMEIVRRTLLLPALRSRLGTSAPTIALAVALLWLVHPLNSECVNYISQRTESIMALFYLLTMWCAIRAGDSSRPGWWNAAAVACCGLGMMSKEVMVTAPAMVVLHDLVFRGGRWRDLVRRRWPLYLGLAGTWAILAVVMIAWPRSGSVGYAFHVGPADYALGQCAMIVRYFRLALWPDVLSIDYGQPGPTTLAAVAWEAAVLATIGLTTLILLHRRPQLGFALAWVFIILAPTSSFVPIATEVGAERRMYLPLAGLVAAAVVIGHAAIRRLVQRGDRRGQAPGSEAIAPRAIGAVVVLAIAAALAGRTFVRTLDYRSGAEIWRSAIEVAPWNSRAYNNRAWALAVDPHASPDEKAEALRLALEGVRLTAGKEPTMLDTYAVALAAGGDFAQAAQVARRAVELAGAAGQPSIAQAIAAHQDLFVRGLPYQEPPPGK